MQSSCSANIPSILPQQAQGGLSRTDLVGKDEGHPGLVTGILSDVANELQHGCDPYNTVNEQLAFSASWMHSLQSVAAESFLGPSSIFLTSVPQSQNGELPFILIFSSNATVKQKPLLIFTWQDGTSIGSEIGTWFHI